MKLISRFCTRPARLPHLLCDISIHLISMGLVHVPQCLHIRLGGPQVDIEMSRFNFLGGAPNLREQMASVILPTLFNKTLFGTITLGIVRIRHVIDQQSNVDLLVCVLLRFLCLGFGLVCEDILQVVVLFHFLALVQGFGSAGGAS